MSPAIALPTLKTIALPDKVTFDRTCQLHIADTQGLGVPSIILTVPHMSPAHWHLELEGNTRCCFMMWITTGYKNNAQIPQFGAVLAG
ncbi:Insecticide toxin TcdB middle/N-terminal region [Cedecea neteri]|uniref:Insecticide toxin TcdB middle/N-terminal region n=1 Tax=Cedecea neteri TaxID=158822 RepID=A0A2X2T5K8_9ENTR|nr:Insecticide toxin TcdB middle/N-terminal region [Cedecea neteri]